MLAMNVLYMLRYLRKCRVAVKKFRSVYIAKHRNINGLEINICN